MTLGIPTENFSFSGAFTVTSKLVVIIIMLRGRHRGLPVAIDRAGVSLPSFLLLGCSDFVVMLPSELIPIKPTDDQANGAEQNEEKTLDVTGDNMQRVEVSAV